jgi:CRP-like cAMP-binding protein
VSNSNKSDNRLLAALPLQVYQRLEPHLQLVELSQGQMLNIVGETDQYAYFPTNAMISRVAILKNGATTEIGVVGSEGMIGLPIILQTKRTFFNTMVQVGGDSLIIPAQELQKEIARQGALNYLLMHYVQARMIQVGQTAACNRHHKLEQRFARWLLMVRDAVQKNEFPLTHEFLSQMLGMRRTGITEIAGKFQKADIIKYKRGTIEIIDGRKLEATSCECYRVVSQQFSDILDIPLKDE